MNRVITKWGAVAVVAGSMLGVGIFLTPPLVAREVGSASAFLFVWLLGGLVALAGATVYGELGAMFPKAGGDYVYVREAFGDDVSFATGIVLFFGIFAGSIAAMSVALFQYQVHALVSGILGIGWMADNLGPFANPQIGGVLVVVVLTCINILGAKASTRFQLATTILPIGLLLIGAVLALGYQNEPPPVQQTTMSARGLLTAFAGVYFAYAGWNGAAYVAGEIDEPGRNLPLALLVGTGIITLVYVVACAGFVALVGFQGVRDSGEVGSAAARWFGGPSAELAIAALTLVALLGSVNATVLGGARIAHAMARSNNLPVCIGDGSTVPVRALSLQCGVSAVLIFSGTFESLIEMNSITMMLLAGIATAALFRLRLQRPNAERPYRAYGYPLVPALFLLACVGMVAIALVDLVAPTDASDSLRKRALPLVGVLAFIALMLGRRLLSRVRKECAV